MQRLLSIFFAIIILTGFAPAKSWRGITPLKSTKEDVIRLLGKPSKSDEGAVYYDLAKEIVVIDFAEVGCDSIMGKFGFGWNVSPGKVEIIGVIPKTRMRAEDAGVTSKYKKKDDYGDFVYFTNDDEGLQIEVYDGAVTNIQYQPTEKDKSLKCPNVQQCCWDVFPRLDGYGRPSRNDLLGHYHFFIQRVDYAFGRGIVVVMGRNPIERTKRMGVELANVNRFCRAFKFLHERMLVDGGYAPVAQTELHMYPIASEINWIYIPKNPDPEPKQKAQQPK